MNAIGPGSQARHLVQTRQWLTLLACSAALSALLVWLHVPAALLLGPMLAGIADRRCRRDCARAQFSIPGGSRAHRLHDRQGGAAVHRRRDAQPLARLLRSACWAVIAVAASLGWLLTPDADSAGYRSSLGFEPGSRYGDDRNGGSAWCRRTPRRLHAISARGCRCRRRVDRSQTMGPEPVARGRQCCLVSRYLVAAVCSKRWHWRPWAVALAQAQHQVRRASPTPGRRPAC